MILSRSSMNSRSMPCQSCIATEKFGSSSSGTIQFHGKHGPSWGSRGGYRLKKGFPLRPRFRTSQISALESSSDWHREESRWLREEDRWKREEQRWLREERRWNADRESWAVESSRMKQEIAGLRKEIERLRDLEKIDASSTSSSRSSSSSSLKEVLVGLLRTLGDKADQQPSPTVDQPAKAPAMVTEQSVESIKFVLSPSDSEDVNASAASSDRGMKSAAKPAAAVKEEEKDLSKEKSAPTNTGSRIDKQERRSLQYGAEGDDVKHLQEALAKLGFYSGDDDMEYASFSSGTDRAVKSWQASIGAPEDGIVTARVLSRLVSERQVVAVNSSAAQIKNPPPEVVDRRSDIGRVYLLGENRWEDPDRLLHRRRENPAAADKCFTCKGEGRTLCTECDATGELNVEEQFLEWAGEGAKCPYCEGSGTVLCEDCDGKGVAIAR